MNADGTDQHRLTHNSDDDLPISFSADGKRIFFGTIWKTWVMDSDGSNVHDLGERQGQALSLDGRQLAFGTSERGRHQGVSVMNADGTGRRVIYPSRAAVSELSFTPDGAHVVFVEWQEVGGAGRIKIVNLVTSEIELIPEI